MTQKPPVSPSELLDTLNEGLGGWDALKLGNFTGAMQSVARGDFDAVAEVMAGFIATPGGELVMQFLISEFFWRSASYPGDVMGADQLMTYGPFIEGQKSIVVLLHELAARGRELEIQQEEPRDE